MNLGMHAYVLAELQAWKGRWSAVADGSGVSLRTVEKIARKEIKDPGVSHIEKLAGFFARHSSEQRAA